jgi:hypothetical protein
MVTSGPLDAAQLKAALAGARAGDVITLAAGTYDGAFFGTASGTASAPITLTGPKTAILSDTKNGCDPNVPSGRSVTYCGFGLHLNKASFWKLTGFSVKSVNKGIVLDTVTVIRRTSRWPRSAAATCSVATPRSSARPGSRSMSPIRPSAART